MKTLLTLAGTFTIAAASFIPNEALSEPLFNVVTTYEATQASQSSKLVVQISQQEIITDSGKSVEIVAPLMQPVLIQGQTVPANSLVKIIVSPTESGDAYLLADTLLFNGYEISINASSSMIPGIEVTEKGSMQTAKEGSGFGSHIGERISLALGGDAEDAIQGGSGGDLVGTLVGSLSSQKRNVVLLQQGIYILNLE